MPRSLLRKILICLGGGLLGLDVTYILAVAIFLNTPIFTRTLGLDPNSLILDFSFGWSVVPGFVHLHGLHLDSQDEGTHWNLRIPSVEVHVSLAELLQKKLHIYSLASPGGLAFKFHLKTPAEKAAYRDEPDHLSVEQKREKRWRLQFDRIQLHDIDRLEFADWVYAGGSDIDGSFSLWPGLEAEVGPVTLAFHSGTVAPTNLAAGSRPPVARIAGQVFVHIEKFEPFRLTSAQILDYLGLRFDATADVAGSEWLNSLLIRTPSVHMTDGDGKLKLAVKVARGALAPESSLELDSEKVSLEVARARASGRGSFRARVVDAKAGALGEAVLELRDFEIKDRANGERLGLGPRLDARLASPDLRLASLFARRRFELAIAESKISGHGNWAEFLGPAAAAFSVVPGEGTFSLRLFAHDGMALTREEAGAGFIRMALPSLQAKYSGAVYQGSFGMEASMAPFDFGRLEGLLRNARIQATAGTWTFPTPLGSKDNPIQLKDWWGKAEIEDLRAKSNPGLAAEGKVRLELKDDEPVIGFYRIKNDIAGWKASLVKQGPVLITSDLWKTERAFGLRRISLTAGPIGARGELSFAGQQADGQLLIHYSVISVGVKLVHGQAETKIMPGEHWLDSAKNKPKP